MKRTFLVLCMLCMLFFAVSFGASGCSSINVEQAGMSSAVSSDKKPLDVVSTYYSNAPELIAFVKLKNAPAQTKVRFVWEYITEPTSITEKILKKDTDDSFVFCSLKSDTSWALGDYRVKIYINDRQKPDATLDFKIL